jgi:hypothetical protein
VFVFQHTVDPPLLKVTRQNRLPAAPSLPNHQGPPIFLLRRLRNQGHLCLLSLLSPLALLACLLSYFCAVPLEDCWPPASAQTSASRAGAGGELPPLPALGSP